MVRSGVGEENMVLVAELVEIPAGELSADVQDDYSRGPEVCNTLPQCLCNLCCVICFQLVEPNVPTVVIYDGENISVPLDSINHISEVYSCPLQCFVFWREFLPLL